MNYRTAAWAAVVFLACFNIFFRLSGARVEEWDEARRGVAAFEMYQSGRYAVHTYRGVLDYWSAKPPLGLWLIAGSYRVFGVNRFALRFPSALAALLTVAIVCVATARRYGTDAGIAAGVCLSTTYPFLLEHSARHGEYDAPFALLVTIAFAASVLRPAAVSSALIAGGCTGAGFLCKSFAAALIPICFAASLRTSGLRWRQVSAACAVVLGAAVLTVAPWLCARYLVDGTDFFLRMLKGELVERTVGGIEGNGRPLGWYLFRMVKTDPAWLAFAIIAAALLRKRMPKGSKAVLWWVAIPFAAFSIARTKLPWYINPIFPPAAVLIGACAAAVYQGRYRAIGMALFCAAFVYTEAAIVYRILRRTEPSELEMLLSAAHIPPDSRLATVPQEAWFLALIEHSLKPVSVLGAAPSGAFSLVRRDSLTGGSDALCSVNWCVLAPRSPAREGNRRSGA